MTFPSLSQSMEFGTMIGMVVLGIMQRIESYRSKHRSIQTDRAVSKVQSQADNVHTLVNGAMSTQLRLTSTALRRVADLTKDPKDSEIADEAERLLAEHMAKQAAVVEATPIIQAESP